MNPIFFVLLFAGNTLFTSGNAPGFVEETPIMSNTEHAGNWTDLSSLSHWHCYNKEGVGAGWEEESGVISFNPDKKDGGDLITNGEYEDFEFSIEWKIAECGNSGIMFNVHEAPNLHAPYLTGPEMQVLDNECHPDAKIITHRAGDLYDMISCSEETVKPAGEWNHVIIRSEKGKVVFHLNDVKVVEFTMFDDNWKDMIANSKFKSMPAFGTYKKGKIALQDHSDRVWFRNIKIKEL